MIICCGEALMDMLPRTLPKGEQVFLPVAGGAIFNTAIALGRLNEAVGFLAGISEDMFGAQLIDVLKKSQVHTGYCIRVQNPTTLAFVQLDSGQASYSFMDENSATRSLDLALLPKLSDDVSALHFGAISLISEPCGTVYEALLMREAKNRVISLDPNIRPSIIRNDGMHRARIMRMIGRSDIVKVSDEDLDWIYLNTAHQDGIAAILDAGASVVLLTKGSAGVTAYTAQGSCDVAAQQVEVVDTIAAGDTFNAGFMARLRQKGLLNKHALQSISFADLTAAVELANRVAAITVSRAGANPPWLSEL